MPGGLPEVEQTWVANVSEYIDAMDALIGKTSEAAAAVEALQGVIDDLHGKTVDLGVDTAAASAAAAVNDLAAAEWKANAAGQMQMETTRLLAESDALLADQDERLTAAYADRARNAGLLLGAEEALNGASREAAQTLILVGSASDEAGAAAGTATRAYWGWWGALGALNRANISLFSGVLPGMLGAVGGLHLLADAVLEVAAVVIPAGVALAAFGVAGSDAFKQVVTQVQNMHTVMDATGQSIYPFTGALEALHRAVAPQVYQLFGDAILAVSHNTGLFSSLAKEAGTVVDQLASRLTVAVTSGHGFEQFLANAGTDLAKLGDIVGNIGGIIGNVIKVIPGYAQVLLNFADGFTKVGEAVTGSAIGEGIMRFGLAAHGAILYVGLLGTMADKLLTGFGRFPGVLSLASDALGAGARAAAALGGEEGIAAVALGTLSSKLSLAQGLPWGWITLGAAAVGILAYKFITAKDAADQFIASFNQGLGAAPLGQVTADIAAGITVMNQRMGDATATMSHFSYGTLSLARDLAPIAPGLQDVGNWFTRLNDSVDRSVNSLLHFNLLSTDNQQNLSKTAVGAAVAVHDYQAYQHEVQTLTQQGITFTTRLGVLAAAFHGTAEAIGILNAAGIKSSQMLDTSATAWARILAQVNATLAAYKAMGQQSGVLGADMNAMTIAGSDQVAAMQKLNQAFDSTISIVSGGQTAFVSFEQAVGKGSGNLIGVATAAKAAGASMTGLNQQSLNLRGAWQQAYTGGAQLVDALRMMIAVSPNASAQNRNLSQSVKDVVAQLATEGSKSAATRAELVSLAQEVNPAVKNFSELKTWLGDTGNAAQDLQRRLAGMGVNIQDLAADAAHLSSTMNSQLTAAFSANKLQANGTMTAIQNLASAVGHNASAASQSAAKLTLFSDLVHKDGYSASAAAALISALTGTIFKIPTAHHTNITTNSAQVAAEVAAVQASINSLHGVTVTNTVITQYISAGQRDVGAGGYATFHQHGGIIPGFMPGRDIVPAMLSPGEAILNPYATRMLGDSTIHALNYAGEHGGALNPAALRTGGAPAYGGGEHSHPIVVTLDGREVFNSMKVHGFSYQTRNSGNRTGIWKPT